MRTVKKNEKDQRGCIYCADMTKGKCKHDECPYYELDDFEKYEDFFKSRGSIFDEIFKEVIQNENSN